MMKEKTGKMENIAILCSGGDAPGMNAAIRSVVRTAIFNGMRVFGIQNGYRGLIDNLIIPLQVNSVSDIIHRGGTVLGSARSQRFKTETGRAIALQNLENHDIDGVVVLGGDGSFKGAMALDRLGVKVVGIPCTIDNDLGYTDYTIGFYTAVETVLDAIGKLRDTSSSHGIGVIVEVMGRHCGDIALYAGLAGGAETVIVPEVPFDVEEIVRKVVNGKNRGKKHHIILLAEGVETAENLCAVLIDRTGIDFRKTILGHIQRGGTPSAFDRLTASLMGSMAVDLLIQNRSSRAIGTDGKNLFHVSMRDAVTTPHQFNETMYRVMRELSI